MTDATQSPRRDFDFVLVLGGGNALGAFEAGVYEALHERDLQPDWIVGASIGAINGALILGSAADRRLETLRRFWRPDAPGMGDPAAPWLPAGLETSRRTAAAAWTVATGRQGMFGPPLSAMNPWSNDRHALFETEQLASTLDRMVDFDALNSATCRFTATAVDLATGDDVVFDSNGGRIDVRHIRASAALPVAFPPVEVDGRWCVDAGVSANLPLDPVLAEASARPTLCIAVDLLPLGQPLPATLGESASRLQDLIFAAQSRRTIARWRAAHDGDDGARTTLLRLAYGGQEVEVAGKAFDFSGPTIRQRWSAGYQTAHRALGGLDDGTLPLGAPGLNVVDVEPG